MCVCVCVISMCVFLFSGQLSVSLMRLMLDSLSVIHLPSCACTLSLRVLVHGLLGANQSRVCTCALCCIHSHFLVIVEYFAVQCPDIVGVKVPFLIKCRLHYAFSTVYEIVYFRSNIIVRDIALSFFKIFVIEYLFYCQY